MGEGGSEACPNGNLQYQKINTLAGRGEQGWRRGIENE
jgi:hypothetical protein